MLRKTPLMIGLALIGSWSMFTLLLMQANPPAEASQRQAQTSAGASPTLDELVSGRLSIVDLTWTLDADNPYWPAENYEPFHLKTIATIDENGVLSKAF